MIFNGFSSLFPLYNAYRDIIHFVINFFYRHLKIARNLTDGNKIMLK